MSNEMFLKPTVFILGAGASWHYGYPTGEDLVRQVRAKAEQLASFFKIGADGSIIRLPKFVARNHTGDISQSSAAAKLWTTAKIEAEELSTRLKQVNPIVIDYFLAQNEDIQDIGKLAIAGVILECEHREMTGKGNKNHLELHARKLAQGLAPASVPDISSFNDDWIRFLVHKMTSNCARSKDIFLNNVKFVTFNYDVSLERRLFRALRNIHRFDRSDITAFLGSDRILHVYGGVREKVENTPPLHQNFPTTKDSLGSLKPFWDACTALDILYESSLGIQTIDGTDKLKRGDILEAAQSAINGAHTTFILGYGFDQQNCRRIGLANLSPSLPMERDVFFTNFGGRSQIAKMAGTVLLNDANAFRETAFQMRDPFIQSRRSVHRYEMSTRNVYDALEQDFDLSGTN